MPMYDLWRLPTRSAHRDGLTNQDRWDRGVTIHLTSWPLPPFPSCSLALKVAPETPYEASFLIKLSVTFLYLEGTLLANSVRVSLSSDSRLKMYSCIHNLFHLSIYINLFHEIKLHITYFYWLGHSIWNQQKNNNFQLDYHRFFKLWLGPSCSL